MLMQPRTQLALWLAALLTGLVGIVNLLSAVTPSLPDRVKWLTHFLPFEVQVGAHFFAAITGFALLTLAANLLRRKRVAWVLTVGLLVASILSNLLKGLDYEESLLSGFLLIQLLLLHKVYTAQSDRPSIAQGIRVLLGALLFTLAYGTLGFYILDRQYTVNFDFQDALIQTLAMFFTADNAGLKATTRFGQFFADSVELVGAVTLLYAFFMLLRPVLMHDLATAEERQRARAIVEEYGRSSLARFTLLSDKAYYFSPSGRSVIAYVAKGRGAIALGDPIGPSSELREAIVGFQAFCERNDWYPAFYQTQPDNLELYRSLEFEAIQIGEEGIIDLSTFTLQGKAYKNQRASVNRLTKLGYRVTFYEPPISQKVIHELKEISDQWLQSKHGSEKHFSVGWFDVAYLRECTIAAVQTPKGQISAFANLVPGCQDSEVTVDLMRKRNQVENGTMEFLFISMFQHFQKQGYASFSLGLSALAGVGATQNSFPLEKGVHYLYEHLNQFYNFKGLHLFKEHFRPHWEPRYLVYPKLSALPEVTVALVRADSGDRLLDYLKPDT